MFDGVIYSSSWTALTSGQIGSRKISCPGLPQGACARGCLNLPEDPLLMRRVRRSLSLRDEALCGT